MSANNGQYDEGEAAWCDLTLIDMSSMSPAAVARDELNPARINDTYFPTSRTVINK
jgi:hypothetical protein